MHEKYGPIVRINPYEVHVSDPEFFNTIYSQTEKRDAWHWRKKGFGIDVSTLTTLEHDLHRKRRSALNPLFSKQRIVKLQPVIQYSVDALVERVRLCGMTNEIIDLKVGFAALTAGMYIPLGQTNLTTH
jgi:cytochrome P450